jgi:hypothetical protein
MTGIPPGRGERPEGRDQSDWLPKPPRRPLPQGLKVLIIVAVLILVIVVISVIAGSG